tara:strand:+ start:500 stop:1045 length:546 start_codon:yes stop_codon:yes gene_type:complete
MEAKLKTMPDDIINLVFEFMPSYIRDIKHLLDKVEDECWCNIRARFGGIRRYILYNKYNKYTDFREFYAEKESVKLFNKPIYPLPISPYFIRRAKNPFMCIKQSYIAYINTYENEDGNIVLDDRFGRKHYTPTGKTGAKKLQDIYSIAQLDLIVEFYGLKVPSKIKKNKTKYIQYLMKQEF